MISNRKYSNKKEYKWKKNNNKELEILINKIKEERHNINKKESKNKLNSKMPEIKINKLFNNSPENSK